MLAAWKARLTITDYVWAVAVSIVPVLVERGEARYTLAEIAARTGLSVHRVHDCLRFLLKRGCIRQINATSDGAPVYVLRHP
ncbi:winged helix-turn-helix domain-containing protein [Streptomyces gobiensis]|uniref:winged helix-turn-helix domain-containing protein n=1 Tax=Streptomyces gobiensis TaxID=2875706 RepID=UPI001E443C22|nr:winged helix-turn-helix domain-containing protein [Streptomyces gobiensis]UGY92584.1 winged helix-turn-helix domain-containing protein [Streptomyces gobiensis]